MTTAHHQPTEQIEISWLATAILFWLGNVVLHLEFSNWLVRSYDTPIGQFVPRDFSVHGAVIVALLVAGMLWRKISKGEIRLVHTLTWILWSTVAIAAYFLIMTTPIEAIHYIQYGILAYLLAGALDPAIQRWPLLTLLFITVGLGIIDELNQYFLLTPGNSTYVDFNDFVLNQLGAQAGLFAYYAGLQHSGSSFNGLPFKRAAVITLTAYGMFALLALVLLILGRLGYSPPMPVPPGGILDSDGSWTIYLEREAGLLESWQTSFGGGRYYVLGVVGGAVAMAALTLCTTAFAYATRKS